MGLVGCGPQARFPVRLVVGVVPVEPDDPAVPLEGEDVGGDPVEEPAVVADHHHAAREIFQPVLQGPQGVHVQIIRGLVEEEHVRFFLQHPGQVDAVAFPSGEGPDLLLLGRAGEVEPGHVGAGIDFPIAEGDQVLAL